jgi:hypothetical protein
VSHDVDAKMRIGVWKQHGKQRFLFRMVNFGQQDVDDGSRKDLPEQGKETDLGVGMPETGSFRGASCRLSCCHLQ